MTTDLAFLRLDTDEEATLAAPRRRGREAAPEALARLALEQALTPTLRSRIRREKAHALVVEVPSAEWVDPIREACELLRPWTAAFPRNGGASRTEHVPSRGNDIVAKTLSHPGSVLGVSQNADAYLPSSLVAAADTRLTIGPPNNALVERVIRAVTGRTPPALPDRAAAGLSFWEVAACI